MRTLRKSLSKYPIRTFRNLKEKNFYLSIKKKRFLSGIPYEPFLCDLLENLLKKIFYQKYPIRTLPMRTLYQNIPYELFPYELLEISKKKISIYLSKKKIFIRYPIRTLPI